MKKKLKVLVGMVVYNRKNTLAWWLRAWQNAEKYNDAKLIVIHNYDRVSPNYDAQRKMIIDANADYYYPRRNIGMDIGALKELIHDEKYKPWDVLLWFTDDNVPMCKDFIKAFVKPFAEDENIGLVGNYWVSKSFYANIRTTSGFVPDHFRTCSFAISHNAAIKLKFPDRLLSKADCYNFEWHSDDNMTNQIKRMGYKSIPVCNDWNKVWTDTNEYVWDVADLSPNAVDIRKRKDLWLNYEKQFVKV